MIARLFLLLTVCLPATLSAEEAPKPDPDFKLFLGQWNVASVTEGGTEQKETRPRSMRFTDGLAVPKDRGFLGYLVTIEQHDGQKFDRAYTINSAKDPKEFIIYGSKVAVPFTSISAPAGRLGAYVLKKERLTIYLAPEGKDLPKDLTQKSEGLLVLELQRSKP